MEETVTQTEAGRKMKVFDVTWALIQTRILNMKSWKQMLNIYSIVIQKSALFRHFLLFLDNILTFLSILDTTQPRLTID